MQLGLILYAKNLNALADFYINALGFEKVDGDETYAKLLNQETELVILQAPPEFVDEPTAPRELVPMKPIFFVNASLGEMRTSITQNGGFFKPPESEWKFNDHIVCDGHDIDGNIFQVRSAST